jgi:hypothetical protein
MPKFPTYERSVGLGGGATASYASEGAFTAPGRALAGLGDAIEGLGSKLSAAEEARQKFEKSRESAWVSRTRAEAARDLNAEKFGTVQDVQTAVDAYSAAASENAPTIRAGSIFKQWSGAYSAHLVPEAARSQAVSAIAARDADMQQAITAHADLVSADPTQFDVVMARLNDDFEGARMWMDEPSRQVAYEAGASVVRNAYGNAILAQDPDELYRLAQDETSPFTPEERARFTDAANTRIYEIEAANSASELNADGEIMADMIDQVVNGNLDADWLESNRDLIGENSYHRALGEGVAQQDRPDPVDPAWLENAYSLAVEDPEAGGFHAWDFFSEGMMSKDTLGVFWNMAKDAKTPEGVTRNQARKYLLAEMGGEGEGRFPLMREFERYLSDNPKAGLVEMQDQARKMAEPFRQAAGRKAVMSLPRPKFAPPVAKPDAANMEAARTMTAQKLQKGEINAREAAKEAGVIRRWLKALESFND